MGKGEGKKKGKSEARGKYIYSFISNISFSFLGKRKTNRINRLFSSPFLFPLLPPPLSFFSSLHQYTIPNPRVLNHIHFSYILVGMLGILALVSGRNYWGGRRLDGIGIRGGDEKENRIFTKLLTFSRSILSMVT